MKRYKLAYQHKGFYNVQYFSTKQEAENFVINFGVTMTDKICKVELMFHHTASQRGYICKGHERDEYYKGRFGEGIIRHKQNATFGSPNNSKQYHFVEYYIEIKK